MNVCVLALDIRHANRIYYAPHYIVFFVLSDGGIFFFFSKLSHTLLDFRKTKLFYIKYLLSFSLQFFLPETFFIQEEFNVCVCVSSCKVPVIIVIF